MKRKYFCALLCAPIVWTLGCANPKPVACSHQQSAGRDALTLEIQGNLGAATYNINNNSTSRKTPIGVQEEFETENLLHLHAESTVSPPQNYDTILGRTAGKNPSRGQFLEIQGSGIDDGLLIFYLDAGWAYAYGNRPRIKTNRAIGSAEGSAILVQANQSQVIQRFIFVEKTNSPMTVTNFQATPVTKTIPNDGYYVNVALNGDISDPIPIPKMGEVDTDGIREFRNRVLDRVTTIDPGP